MARDRVGRGLPAEDPIPAHGYVLVSDGSLPAARLEPGALPSHADSSEGARDLKGAGAQ